MRIARQAWQDIDRTIEASGYAVLPGLLDAVDCDELIAGFDDATRFRSTIEMARHAYGEGRYRYFAYPLPDSLQELRGALYERLLPTARAWQERLGTSETFPDEHGAFLQRCHLAGQPRPTPLVLRYETGGYNRMHQDTYGEIAFPLQVACLLSPVESFDGGEFLISENRPRMQVRTEAVRLEQGDGIVFANTIRPVPSPRGYARADMRHGMSRVRRGTRYALGVIFHDAA